VTRGFPIEGLGIGSERTRIIVSKASLPSNSRRLVNSSYMMMPTAQRSAR